MNIRKTIQQWTAFQKTLRELNALEKRDLYDLGISRSDFQRIARDHAKSI